MKSCQFTDKQIMDLSSSLPPPSSDFIDLQQRVDEILPSYDFQPIRPSSAVGLSHSALDLAGASTTSSRVHLSASDSTSPNRGFGSLDSIAPAKLVPHKVQNVSNTTIISEIDRTMKKHADTLLHVMESFSARLTQLETGTLSLEHLVDDLKVSVDNSHGSTDGKLRQLKIILVEVQSGVQLLKDKQEIVEAQLQLSKHQVTTKVGQHTKTHSLHVDPNAQSPAPVPMQQMLQFSLTSFPQPPSSTAAPSQLPSSQLLAQRPTQFSPQQELYCPPPSHSQPPPPNQPPYQAPQTPTPHQPPSSTAAPSQPPSSQLLAQRPTQFSPQQEPYCPPPSHSQPPPPNQPPYQAPQTPTPHQPPYQSPPQQPQYPQQTPPSSGYNLEEQPPYLMQSYPPNPPRQQPPAGSAPSQQIYNPPQPQPSMYDGAGGRSNSGFPSGYSSEPYPYTGSPMTSAKPPHTSSSGTGYPQLSNSRPLPMASAVSSGGGSSSARSESRVPIDDVIDRVTTMGFPRDQVRATVRKLTENGQAVDLNVVLDKLMNEGGAPRGGWFGSQ